MSITKLRLDCVWMYKRFQKKKQKQDILNIMNGNSLMIWKLYTSQIMHISQNIYIYLIYTDIVKECIGLWNPKARCSNKDVEALENLSRYVLAIS